MGEYFLVKGLMSIGLSVGYMMFIIPGIVISIAWSFSTLIVIDQDKNALEAVRLSNNGTYGKKWLIWGTFFLLRMIFVTISAIVFGILQFIHPAFAFLVVALLWIFFYSILLSAKGYIYKALFD